MNRIKKITTLSAIVAGTTLAASHEAGAVPITGQYIEDARCDAIPTQQLTHELGDAATFPPNEAILVQVTPATFQVCAPQDNIANDWTVQITNVSGQAWQNLFFVGDLGMRVGNADGNTIDVVNAPGVITDAFRIDGTVTLGVNNNLLSESMINDEIFWPGETWTFNVDNFVGPGNINPPPVFIIPGFFGGSSPITVPPSDTASILATPYVPEPSMVGAVGLISVSLLARRPRRTKA